MGEGGILKLKSLKVPRSCLNFNFRGGGGILKLKSLKVPRSLTIFIFGVCVGGGEGEGGYSETVFQNRGVL